MDVKQRLLLLKRDVANALRYGPAAPRHSQIIYVDPAKCKRLIDHHDSLQLGLLRSGVVTSDKFWKGVSQKVKSSRKIKSILSHWDDGVPWEDTEVFKWTVATVQERPGHEGCYTEADVVRRYETLDAIYREVQTTGRFRTQPEIDPSSVRGQGAPVFHLGKKGKPIFGGSGYHRFCIGLSLGVEVPGVVGTVHRSALTPYADLTAEAADSE